MLTTKCINPVIMEELAYCGHGSKILISDGNYPLQEKSGSAKKVYLALSPDIPTVMDVLRALQSVVNIEHAAVMVPEAGPEPEIFADFRDALGAVELEEMGRYAFYAACMAEGEVALAISTGETRTFANILLTVGCA